MNRKKFIIRATTTPINPPMNYFLVWHCLVLSRLMPSPFVLAEECRLGSLVGQLTANALYTVNVLHDPDDLSHQANSRRPRVALITAQVAKYMTAWGLKSCDNLYMVYKICVIMSVLKKYSQEKLYV